MHKLFIVAAERSGDDLASGLIGALRRINSDIEIEGIGGAAMERAGVISQMSVEGLSILGFVEGLRHYPLILGKVQDCTTKILAANPDAVILIDSWGFMVRVAKQLKKRGYQGKVIKYVAPQVWAMRAGRAKILAQYVDLLLSTQPMDAPYFEAQGLETIYIGNPIFDQDYRSGEDQSFRERHGCGESPIISIWFGSRPSEISQLSVPFAEALVLLKEEFPDLRIVSPISETVKVLVKARLEELGVREEVLLLNEFEKFDVMAASTAALACSGTVTTQLASACVPTIVAYRLNSLTFFIAQKLFKPDYISIVNIAADAELMPEFIQDKVRPENLAAAVSDYLNDESLRQVAIKRLMAQTDLMGANNPQKANEKAARAILTALS